jgi:hypothetical protein
MKILKDQLVVPVSILMPLLLHSGNPRFVLVGYYDNTHFYHALIIKIQVRNTDNFINVGSLYS